MTIQGHLSEAHMQLSISDQ